MRWLSRSDIEAVNLNPVECIAVVRRTIEEHARGKLEMPAKSGVHPPAGRHIHAMSAWLPSSGALGMKWIADFPRNPARGLPTLNAIIVLNDPETGAPLCLMDGAPITAMRTAAMTAVSLQACANPNSRIAAIIGTGVQAREHAKTLTNFSELRIAGLVPEDAVNFCRDMGAQRSDLLPAPSREEAIRGADVVITLTNAVSAPLLEPDWLKPGVTVIVLDNGGKETRILGFFDRIFTDDRRPFAGEEVRHRFSSGVPNIDAQIGDILVGDATGRCGGDERILILNLGIAACDISVAHAVYRRSTDLGFGREL